MRLGVIAMTAAVLFVGGASEGAAQPYIQRTASDSVLVGSLTYPRFTFSVWNFGNAVDLVVATRLASTGPEDTCRVIRAVGPADWIGTVDASDGSVLWGRPSPSVPARPWPPRTCSRATRSPSSTSAGLRRPAGSAVGWRRSPRRRAFPHAGSSARTGSGRRSPSDCCEACSSHNR